MNKEEKLDYLIDILISESNEYKNIEIPKNFQDKISLLRSLMNIRMPGEISHEFLEVQNQFLKDQAKEKGIVKLDDIKTVKEENPNTKLPFADKISLWQGDITRFQVDAIVNAANSKLLGCFVPCHGCIDNIIHYSAGVQLREECNEIMKKQGKDEQTGKAKITEAYNLPSKKVIHTVGPIVYGNLSKELEEYLSNCYKSCLEIALENNIRSIAFCCISTGEFRFPNEKAAHIAINTVINFINENNYEFDRIIFNVFKDIDRDIYISLLKSF